jgi:glutathione S-transferase
MPNLILRVTTNDESLLGHNLPFSHRCRIVLFEKGMDFQVIDVDHVQQAGRNG